MKQKIRIENEVLTKKEEKSRFEKKILLKAKDEPRPMLPISRQIKNTLEEWFPNFSSARTTKNILVLCDIDLFGQWFPNFSGVQTT